MSSDSPAEWPIVAVGPMIDNGFPVRPETAGMHHCAADADDGAARQRLSQSMPVDRPPSELEYPTEVKSPPLFDEVQETLGDFRLLREIGRGGMGVVFEAEQISLGRRVAVKVLPPAAILEPKQLRRFQVKAHAEAALQHPHIVPVIASGQDRGIPYLAMRLIKGLHLAEVIQRRRERHEGGLPPNEVARLGKQAAEALDFAHRNDVLHRDVKPANLLLDDRGHLWITDFGLARIRGDSDLTVSGDMLGTIRYMSPEQVLGRRGKVDHRSDIYSLGSTLYELLTLATPHDGEDRASILRKITLEEPVAPRKQNPTIPLDLEKIILKALAKEPIERYATAGELAKDLERFLDDRPVLARRPSLSNRVAKWARRHRPAVVSTALFFATLLIGLAAAGWWSNSTLRDFNRRLKVEIDRADRHAREAEEQSRKDRRTAAAAQLGRASQALNHGQIERAQEVLRDLAGDARGESLFPFAWRYLWRRARSEVEFLVGPVPRFVGMARSPDGTILATVEESNGLQLWVGGVPRRLDEPTGEAARFGGPAFSLDGTMVAVPRQDAGCGSPRLSLWHVASGECLASLPIEGEIGRSEERRVGKECGRLLPVPGPTGATGDLLDRPRAAVSGPALEPGGPISPPVEAKVRTDLCHRVVPEWGGVRRLRRGRHGHHVRLRYRRPAPRAPARRERASSDRLLVGVGLGGEGVAEPASLELAHRGF